MAFYLLHQINKLSYKIALEELVKLFNPDFMSFDMFVNKFCL